MSTQLNDDEILNKLHFPCTILVVGASQSGKTTFVLNLIRNREKVFSEPITRVIYVYSEDQEAFHKLASEDSHVIFTNSINDVDGLVVDNTILIFDDMLQDFIGKQNNLITEWFIKRSHHRKTTVILLSQCLFPKNLRTVSLNCTYLVLFNLIRDISAISRLASQFVPGNTAFLLDAYRKATRDPYRYLLLDFYSLTNQKYRVRSSIFIDDSCEIYVPL